MIYGAKYWNDPARYYKQTNNPTEALLAKMGKGLETCGPSSAVNCLAALGYTLEVAYPGGYVPQPEEILSDYMNDPRNYPKLRAARADIDPAKMPGNRVPQYYPLSVREVFNAKAEYTYAASWDAIKKHFKAGNAVQICLEKPGHYLAGVAFDPVTDELIYHDPCPERTGKGGRALRMGHEEYLTNVKNFCIVYSI
jgi:hypothetical protein